MRFKKRTLYIPATASMDMSKKHKQLEKEKTCTGCDKMFPEHELTLCRARKNMETICLCPGCFIESPYYYSEWGA